MTRHSQGRHGGGGLSWALSRDADRRDDLRGTRAAICFAFLVHAGLLAVRLNQTVDASAPRPDAVIFPVRTVAVKQPKEPRLPEPAVAEPEVPAVKIPVPEAPPEPFPEPRYLPEIPEAPVLAPPLEASVLGIPEAPVPESSEPVRYSREMQRPVRVSGAEPGYTEAARRTRTQGVVVLEAVIDEAGRVREIAVLRALGFGLTESAVRAVGGWRFEPATLAGRPVAVRYNLTVRFSLR